MASLALRCGKGFLNAETKFGSRFDRTEAAPCFVRLKRRKQMVRAGLISNANATKTLEAVPLHGSNQETFKRRRENTYDDKKPINPEKLDDWIHESITEIVRNIGEAPFLVHIYSDKEKESSTRFEREIATAENWPHIRRGWEEGNNTPDGVILVEQLSDEERGEAVENSANCSRSSSLCSRLWGIVIQGRGLDCTACYILKTSRVCSSHGFCTHFCLVRAKCFGKAAELQLRDSWLC